MGWGGGAAEDCPRLDFEPEGVIADRTVWGVRAAEPAAVPFGGDARAEVRGQGAGFGGGGVIAEVAGEGRVDREDPGGHRGIQDRLTLVDHDLAVHSGL